MNFIRQVSPIILGYSIEENSGETQKTRKYIGNDSDRTKEYLIDHFSIQNIKPVLFLFSRFITIDLLNITNVFSCM